MTQDKEVVGVNRISTGVTFEQAHCSELCLFSVLFFLLWNFNASATTIYIVGSGGGSFTPASTVTAKIECWGAGQSFNASTLAGGAGAYYAAKNSFSLTALTPVAFNLGAYPTAPSVNGGDTWFSTAATVIAPGGGSATAAIGDTNNAGGTGGAGSSGNGSLAATRRGNSHLI